jgi:hypothetical protein
MWALAPFGRTVDMMGTGETRSFGITALHLLREGFEALQGAEAIGPEHSIAVVGLLGLFTPLYPSVIAALLLVTPNWTAARRRWVWILEGVIVLLLSPLGGLMAIFTLVILIPGAPPPVLYLPLWLLTGFGLAGGAAAIVIGVARRGRIARIVLGEPAPPKPAKRP